MQKQSDFHFKYPPNIHEMDLATMVNLFRSRGEVKQATPGHYLACAVTNRLIREGKYWFGLYYSQKGWDQLLTKNSEGYPLTDVELIILGKVFSGNQEERQRELVERTSGITDKLAYLVVSDLRAFGFLAEDQQGVLSITTSGEKALHGIARRIYNKRFVPSMLDKVGLNSHEAQQNEANKGKDQRSLF